MSTATRASESSDLDFTATIVTRTQDIRVTSDDAVDKLLRQTDTLMDAAQLQITLGCRDQRVWKLLAAVYIGADRIAEYNELARNFQSTFGLPLKLDLPAAVFELPEKINDDSVPDIAAVKSACASPGGAVVDFSDVRRASSGGLAELARFLAVFEPSEPEPELRGMEPFVNSVTAVAQTERGSREMWDLLFALKRFQRDPAGYADIASRFSTRYGIDAPGW
jgi:hypothetical protein